MDQVRGVETAFPKGTGEKIKALNQQIQALANHRLLLVEVVLDTLGFDVLKETINVDFDRGVYTVVQPEGPAAEPEVPVPSPDCDGCGDCQSDLPPEEPVV